MRCRRLCSPLGWLLGAAMLAGCAATHRPLTKSDSYMIAPAQAEFYKYGPAQAFGPDQALKRGERVTLVQRQFGYSRVALADGTSGYVATEDLAPAPPPPPTPRPSLAFTGGAHGRGGPLRPGSRVLPTNDPLFDVNDTPLPKDAESPPHFHY